MKKVVFTTIAILIVAIALVGLSLFWSSSNNQNDQQTNPIMQLKTGDHFTYTVESYFHSDNANAILPSDLAKYNSTEYCKVTVTSVNGANMSLTIEWKFHNGTIQTGNQTIDLMSGRVTDENQFSDIYLPDLKANDMLHPNTKDSTVVSSSSWAGDREQNYWSKNTTYNAANNVAFNFTEAYFDKQTGVMQRLNNLNGYNNPSSTIVIAWQILETNVWVD